LSIAIFLQVAAVGLPLAGFTEVLGEALLGAVAVVEPVVGVDEFWAKAAVVLNRAVTARAVKSLMGGPHLNQTLRSAARIYISCRCMAQYLSGG
jgi:hypothetical protein